MGTIKVSLAEEFIDYIRAIRMIDTVVKTCELHVCNLIELILKLFRGG